MPDLNISISIPEGKVAEYAADYLRIHPNRETIADPEWVDPEDGSVAPQIPVYTNGQWIKEHIRRWIAKQIKRGKSVQYRNAETSSVVDDIT